MEGIKYGKSTIVFNGECKEIQTRSIAVSTEDLYKFTNSKCYHFQPTPFCIHPYFVGNCMPCFCCPCQKQLYMWQNYIMNQESRKCEYCYCRNNMYMHNNSHVFHCNPFVRVNNNSSVYSTQSNHSECDELMKIEMKKFDEENSNEVKIIKSNITLNRNKMEDDMQIYCMSNSGMNNGSVQDKEEKNSVTRIPKFNSGKIDVSDSTSKDDETLTPKELLNYANEFLDCTKYTKREENLTSDEDPGGNV